MFLITYMDTCLCMAMCIWDWCLLRLLEGIQYPGAKVTGVWWTTWPRYKTGTWSSARAVYALKRWALSPTPAEAFLPSNDDGWAATENLALTTMLFPGYWPSVHSQQPRELLHLAFTPGLYQFIQVLNPSAWRHFMRLLLTGWLGVRTLPL